MQDSQRVPYDNDEIDLFDIFVRLWKYKWLILLVTLLSISAGLTYIWITKPTYEAKAYILPPTSGDIAGLNIGRSNKEAARLRALKSQDVYDIFINALVSQSTKRTFFQGFHLSEQADKYKRTNSKDALFNQFNSKLTVTEIPKSSPKRYSVTVKSDSPSKAVDWVESYVRLAEKRATQQMIELTQMEARNTAKNLELKIDMTRETAKEKRMDRLVQLKEAMNIAEAIGLNEQMRINSNGNNTTINVASLSEPSLMYQRGIKALQAEVSNLSTRKSDDHYIPHFREIQSELKLYNNIKIKPEDFKLFRLDGAIETPDLPIAPNKRIILFISILLGLMFGVLLSLLWSGVAQSKT